MSQKYYYKDDIIRYIVCLEYTYIEKLFVIYLKFKRN